MAQLLLTIIAGFVALACGSIVLIWPQRIQRWWVGNRLRRKVAMKVYGKFVESPSYIRHLRITGAVAALVGALLFSSALKIAWSLMR